MADEWGALRKYRELWEKLEKFGLALGKFCEVWENLEEFWSKSK
jgi:hypothetical protein